MEEFQKGKAAAFRKGWSEGNRSYEGRAGIITAVGPNSICIKYSDGQWFCPVRGNVYLVDSNKEAAQLLEKEW